MSGGPMIAPHAPVFMTWLARAREVASDLVIATALVWALPLLLGAVTAVLRLLIAAM
jgi:hypothetical protein